MFHAIAGCNTVSAWKVWKIFPELYIKSQSIGSVARRYQWGTHAVLALRSLWIIFMTEQAASRASTEGRSCCEKKQQASPAFLPPRATLVNHTKGQYRYLRMDLSEHQPVLTEPVLPCLSQGNDSLQAEFGYLTGQLFKKWTIHVMKQSTAVVKWCVEDGVSLFKEIWHAQACSTVGATATRTAL